ncbi:restriction endonuclease [Rhodoferax sp. 4810]|nr:restriction endonuclease [Rhodoferax jenense]
MQGQLFTQDFLTRGVLETPPWQALTDAGYSAFESALRNIYGGLSTESTINEAQTEALLINKVLAELGWGDDFLPQVNLSGKRREDVPDCLLFANSERKALALTESKDDRRYRHGLAILEAKRWLRPLDRGDSTEPTDPDAPSSQMLRYLSRADVVSDRAVKWGMLTNGNVWRLYWQDARSRSEEFFEVDVAAALGMAGVQRELDELAPVQALRLFYLFFQREAFLPQSWDNTGRSFHAYALNEARLYEEKVSQDLGARVFADIFPQLADALARGDLHAVTTETGFGQFKRQKFTPEYLEEVREAALVLLYRLLFLFYAEDRGLLPVRDERYAEYSVRRIREAVRDKVDAGGKFSSTVGWIWLSLKNTFTLIDKGDDEVGMPAYNGGLFNRGRAPLLERTNVPDKVMAPIIDALSRRTEDLLHGWINYRDLAVAHLGGIYERLLEYTLVHHVQAKDDYKDKPEIDRLTALPASFARKVSGGYYTHDDLVRLNLRESVGVLAQQRVTTFELHLQKWAKKTALNPGHWDTLDALDPASQMLTLKCCDPAMGSGHFLVALVDFLADRVLEAMATATLHVNAQPWAAHLVESGRPWQSPVLQRIASIRQSIKATAKEHGWAVTDAQLDDRHIVRRMILKKCIFGVDKNPMAVELAKTALWLHTFTVGAPLSFLDHHLRVGDSLHGEQLSQVQKGLQNLGALLLQSEFNRLALAAKAIAQVADLTDADMAEAALSKQLAAEAAEQVAPIHAVLDFWRALRWIIPGWPVDTVNKLPALLKLPKDKAERDLQLKAGQHPDYAGVLKLLEPGHNLVQVLGIGRLDGTDAATLAANALMARARAIARRETFFHWWTTFPTVFGTGSQGGFDVMIGNPPWDRTNVQEVEWFSERNTEIALEPRAANRKKMIAALQHVNMTQTGVNTPPVVDLWTQYQEACERAEANARVLGNGRFGSTDYPLLGGGDINLYSLFVERSQTLINSEGIVALIVPSGIAGDKGAAEFFRSISSTGKLHALFDFENRKVFFPDVDSRFKFCALIFGKQPRYLPVTLDAATGASDGSVYSQENQAPAHVLIAREATDNEANDIEDAEPERQPQPTRCAFFLHSLAELDEPGRVLSLTNTDFQRVNPNTGAAPIFRTQRDANINLKLYERHPVLVKFGHRSETLGQQADVKVWPVRYLRMFHMTHDSHHFRTANELEDQGWQRSTMNRWRKDDSLALPLFEGKMVQMYDHRAADVVVHSANLMRAAQPENISTLEKTLPDRYPQPQYFVDATLIPEALRFDWALGFKQVTAPTNARSMIAALVPRSGIGHSMSIVLPDEWTSATQTVLPLFLANLNSYALDYLGRQKLQGQNYSLYILEQLPVIAPERFDEPLPAAFATAMRAAKLMNGHHPHPKVADFVLPQVLALTYTAHDMAPFARDMGFVDASGNVLPPFTWNEDERRARLAALDALFFWLYGLDAMDATYILSTFPIVREQDQKTFGRYRTQDDILTALVLLTT